MVNEMHRIRSSFIDILWDSIECTDGNKGYQSFILHNYLLLSKDGRIFLSKNKDLMN